MKKLLSLLGIKCNCDGRKLFLKEIGRRFSMQRNACGLYCAICQLPGLIKKAREYYSRPG